MIVEGATQAWWVPTDRFIGEDEDGTPIVETKDGPVRGTPFIFRVGESSTCVTDAP